MLFKFGIISLRINIKFCCIIFNIKNITKSIVEAINAIMLDIWIDICNSISGQFRLNCLSTISSITRIDLVSIRNSLVIKEKRVVPFFMIERILYFELDSPESKPDRFWSFWLSVKIEQKKELKHEMMEIHQSNKLVHISYYYDLVYESISLNI